MAKYLDSVGLEYFWNKIRNTFSTKTELASKADKVTNATSGNFAALDSSGNLVDSGHSHSDYITQHQSLADYVTTNTTQNITGEKTFVGTKRIKFKQGSSSDKLGFTLYNTSSVESGNFEGDIANRAINLGVYAPNTKPASDWLVGFKIQSQDSAGTVHKYGLRTPPRLGDGTYTEHYIPVVINGKEANNAGTLTLAASDVGALPSSTVIPTLVQPNWNETDTGSYAYIQNKPTIITDIALTNTEIDTIWNNAMT